MTAPNLPRVTPADRAPVPAPRPAAARVRVGPVGPRLLLRGAFVGLALLVLVLLLVGCGNGGALPAAMPPPAPATPTTSTPPPTSSAPSTPSTAPTTTGPAPTSSPAPGAPGTGSGAPAEGGGAAAGEPALLWPAGDAPTARRMQEQADRGGDPWLLDPEEVAISYVGAELGYRDPSVTPVGPAGFAVTDGRSPAKATIGLAQTVRRGDGGIWLVTRVDRY